MLQSTASCCCSEGPGEFCCDTEQLTGAEEEEGGGGAGDFLCYQGCSGLNTSVKCWVTAQCGIGESSLANVGPAAVIAPLQSAQELMLRCFTGECVCSV